MKTSLYQQLIVLYPISGYHMAVVAGMVFFIIRGALALVPAVALRHPIKKWAALVALLAATFDLMLSGAEVATQRSYYMIAIVLDGVMMDRAGLTLRTLAIAALTRSASPPGSPAEWAILWLAASLQLRLPPECRTIACPDRRPF
jgi:predicted membrane metal-binding protein